MRLREAKYFLSPTLIDSFVNYLNVENEWNKYYGEMEEDNEKYISFDDYERKTFYELIDRINRVPHETSEAAARGTTWNDIVDTLLHNKPCGRTKMERIYGTNDNVIGIRASVDGFSFDFDINFCNQAAVYFGKTATTPEGVTINTNPSDKCLSQVLVESVIDTDYGLVNLYGFIDEMRMDIVYDIKTTSRYEFGKYEHYNQRYVYPYCLIEQGLVDNIRQFEFTAYQLKGGTKYQPLITGTQYKEVYDYNHEQAKVHIKNVCERFIEFINENRHLITDKNIFTYHEHNH